MALTKKLLTDDVADTSNLVFGAIEGSEFLRCCSANRVLKKDRNVVRHIAEIILVQKKKGIEEKSKDQMGKIQKGLVNKTATFKAFKSLCRVPGQAYINLQFKYPPTLHSSQIP